MADVYYAVRLYRYKRTLRSGTSWKETWFQLKTDGTAIWYNNKQCTETRGKVDFNKAAAHVKIGRVAKEKLPSICPRELPFSYSETSHLMAVPADNPMTLKGSKRRSLEQRKWHWFCFKSENETLKTLRQFAQYFGYDHEFDEFFRNDSDSRNYGNYSRYGIPMGGSADGGRDWGETWDRFLLDIAPYKFLRRRLNGGRKFVNSVTEETIVIDGDREVEVATRDIDQEEENVSYEEIHDQYAVPAKVDVTILRKEEDIELFDEKGAETVHVYYTVPTDPVNVFLLTKEDSGLLENMQEEDEDEDFFDADDGYEHEQEAEHFGVEAWEEVTTRVLVTTYTTMIHGKLSNVSDWADSGLGDSYELLSSSSFSESPAISCNSEPAVVIVEEGQDDVLL